MPFNYILNTYTQEIQTLQINGLNEIDNTILSTNGYPKGARCVVWINLSNGKLQRNGSTSALCATIPIVSMIDNNKTDPYSLGALNGAWWVDDGLQIGQVKVLQTNSGTPDGYLDMNSNNEYQTYNKSDYPRIAELLGTSNNSTFFWFYSTSNTQFSIINVRGRYPRAWSNGSSIDSGRQFTTLQGESLPNVSGFIQWGGSAGGNDMGGAFSWGYQYNNNSNFSDGNNSFTSTKINFSLSNNNATYQDNAQVNPYNFCQKYFIKI